MICWAQGPYALDTWEGRSSLDFPATASLFTSDTGLLEEVFIFPDYCVPTTKQHEESSRCQPVVWVSYPEMFLTWSPGALLCVATVWWPPCVNGWD